MNWTDDFLRRCLSGIPAGRYRRRLRGELEDHLALLAQDLAEAGYDMQEAKTEALRQMGDPASLQRSYREAWLRRPERRLHDLRRWIQGCLLAGICYVLVFGALYTFGCNYDQVQGFSIIGHPVRCALFGTALFAGAYLPDALFLRTAFRSQPHRQTHITAGLLITWAGEKAGILLLSARIYGISPLSPVRLMRQIAHGGDQTAPWFTIPYLVWSFAGCLILGWLFHLERKPKAAA